MILSSKPLAFLLLGLPVLAGCAADVSRYPSLARRDAERMTGSAAPADPVVAPPPAPADPPAGFTARLAAIGGEARTAHAAFLTRADRARTRIRAAAGAAQGSTGWSDAIVAFSDIESARSDTMFALAELDEMLATGAVVQADSGVEQGLPQIAALREQVAEMVAIEDETLAQLAGSLR